MDSKGIANRPKETFMQLVRYGSVTILSYIVLLAGTFCLVEFLHADPTTAYIITLTLVYVAVYLASSLFIFRSKITKSQTYRYLFALLFVWTLNASVYYLLETLLEFQYLVAAVTNILIFGPFRYLVYKLWVFSSPNTR